MRKRRPRVGFELPAPTYASDMSKHRHRGGRVTPKGTRPHGKTTAGNRQGELPLIGDVARCLREASPLGLLLLASSVIEATTGRPVNRLQPGSLASEKRPEVLESFVDSGVPEAEALAVAVAAIHADELLARRLRDRIQIRGSVVRHSPPWLDSIGEIAITDVAEMVHILDDGDNVFVGWRWPNGSAATMVVYIDHNMGTVVKDAFVIPGTFDSMMKRYETIGLEDQVIRPLDPAAARARIAQAVAHGEAVLPPLETDTWPAVRPLVEWIMRALPDGGQGYVRPVWDADQRTELAYEFATSPPAKALGMPLSREMLRIGESLVRFGCSTATGDPLRWSPVSVEMALVDWYPRNVFDLGPDLMQRVPEMMGAFVRFAHDRKQIPSYLTEETLAAVERWTPEYLEAAMRPGRSPRDNVARLIRLAAGVDIDDDTWEDDEDLIDSVLAEAVLDEMEVELIEEAGGPAAYAALNDDPLPDEPFDWSCVPEQWREPTAATLARLDQMTTDLCDVETRTAGRRILAALVANGEVFRRPTDASALAAGIIWALCRQWQISISRLGFKFGTQRELSALTGIKAGIISSRANVLGVSSFDWRNSTHSRRRRSLLDSRQRIEDTRRDIQEDY